MGNPAASVMLALERTVASIKPGHWIFNPLNWRSVGSFVKHMPWDCRALTVDEKNYDAEARILAFKKPNGKVTVVVSNRSDKTRNIAIANGIKQARWKGFRYTPYEAGQDTMGLPVGSQTGARLMLQLLPQS
ncbi:MAG: glycoside hydrolase family 30 beta sandwich domain-containing protein [Blastocatellales bacterium]|nr:glycoside hydrolase family 30 beta sandwich domain-containing protein [Nitrosomonas nitrosa]